MEMVKGEVCTFLDLYPILGFFLFCALCFTPGF